MAYGIPVTATSVTGKLTTPVPFMTEVIHRQSWRTREAVEWATLEWVDWFNHQRLLGPIGDIPPAEAEANYYRQLEGQAMAA